MEKECQGGCATEGEFNPFRKSRPNVALVSFKSSALPQVGFSCVSLTMMLSEGVLETGSLMTVRSSLATFLLKNEEVTTTDLPQRGLHRGSVEKKSI